MMITSLPTSAQVAEMAPRDLAVRVRELVDAGNNIGGSAAFEINRFLAEVAIKFSKLVLEGSDA